MTPNLNVAIAAVFGVALGVIGMHSLYAQQKAESKVLQRADLTGATTTEVVMLEVTAPRGWSLPAHVHHGDEFAYVMEGAVDVGVAGQPTQTLRTGDSIRLIRDTIHNARVSSATPAKFLSVNIVEKGKPLVEPVK